MSGVHYMYHHKEIYMPNDYEEILKKINKNHTELHNSDINISKDLTKIKKSIKDIEEKIYNIDDTVNKMFEILNMISIFIEESEEGRVRLRRKSGGILESL